MCEIILDMFCQKFHESKSLLLIKWYKLFEYEQRRLHIIYLIQRVLIIKI